MKLDPLPAQSLLHDYGLKPKKGLGQNFLVDDTILQRIVEAANITSIDEALEIGAGLGSLTRHLAAAAGQVTAVEIDSQLFPILKKVLKGFDNVRLIQGDIMEIDPRELTSKAGYKVVANIPYYLTSNLIRRLLEAPLKPTLIALTIQKEVAQRVTASPGKMSLLSLGVQVYGKPRIAFPIPTTAFYPIPEVDSALLLVELYDQPVIPVESLDSFFKLAKAAFMQKRKMLHNALAGAPGLGTEKAGILLNRSGIDPDRRAQTLALQEWLLLTENYRDFIFH
ncbi:MAG: 16S rRNA (adenine(1518)-N(6)/adenine(1519)-N(6))-dimethyltransferase RsmA [Pelolinea sp.]|nr:16S rRNA (adenine(1518)-N(6)/adenine(1519)-N(6))-dimethyltransferase RsmA [Pelolinea sp.]